MPDWVKLRGEGIARPIVLNPQGPCEGTPALIATLAGASHLAEQGLCDVWPGEP